MLPNVYYDWKSPKIHPFSRQLSGTFGGDRFFHWLDTHHFAWKACEDSGRLFVMCFFLLGSPPNFGKFHEFSPTYFCWNLGMSKKSSEIGEVSISSKVVGLTTPQGVVFSSKKSPLEVPPACFLLVGWFTKRVFTRFFIARFIHHPKGTSIF